MRVIVQIASIVLATLAACDQPPYIPPTATDTTVPPSDTGDTPDTSQETVAPPCNIQPTLSDINVQYFQKGCTFGGCHDQSSQEADLNFEASNLHGQLVNVASTDPRAGPRGKLRVIPGDPDNSFLVQKLEGTQARDEGNIMPDGADEPIDPQCRIRMVRQWITDGALDN